MEVIVDEEKVSSSPVELESSEKKSRDDAIDISSNWNVLGGKSLKNTVTTVHRKDFSGSMPLDDIADENTSIEIQSDVEHEPCTIVIKIKNGQKIVRMGISSEAEVLEIFKDSGEYATTIFSEFIDEFEGCTVYLGGVVFDRPTRETSIKFTRVKNERSSLYLYGIRLVLEDSKPPDNSSLDQLDYNHIISDFLTLLHPRKNKSVEKVSNGIPTSIPMALKEPGMIEYFHKFVDKTKTLPVEHNSCNDNEAESEDRASINNNDSPNESTAVYPPIASINSTNNEFSTLTSIIDTKFKDMEARLMQRIDQMEKNTNKTLEEILNKLKVI
ncbi:uncharacterized protein [Fopius arisanus]|uniref:Hoxa11b_0 protein n=2 Tax=Fopius arisanus TaxID=64838 RepID=A0A0C9QQL1_9HYME|nr:PREDICTED: uncharacterized protein LOC105271527 isoform X1 [Fopius arisanus]